jgi:hypothetical protein
MGSGCVHEVDVAHIEERGHHVQLWEYLQQELFLTPDCIAKTIKKLLSPEVAHLADSYGVETAKGGKVLCLAITLGTTSVSVMIVIRKMPSCLKPLQRIPARDASHSIKSQLVEMVSSSEARIKMDLLAPPPGFEPGTYGLTARRSNRAELRRRYSALLPALYCVFNKVFATCPSKALVIYLTT